MAQSLGMGKAVMLNARPDVKKKAPAVKRQAPIPIKEAAVVRNTGPIMKKREASGNQAQPVRTAPVKTSAVPLKRTAARKKTFVLDDGLRKMIRQEAAELKMSEEEYLRLMLHFSEVVRTSVLPAGLLDGGLLKMLLGNPMAMGMLKNMIGGMVSRFGSGGSNNAAPSNSLQQGMRQGGAMGGNPMMPMRGGMNPLFPQARAGQMGNPMGNMMYGMNGPGMPGTGQMNGGGQRPMQGWPGASGMPGMQGMPGMGMNPGGGQAPQQGQRGGGGLSNLFSMDNLSQMFMQFFGNQGTS